MPPRVTRVIAAVLFAVGGATSPPQLTSLSPDDLAEYPAFDSSARNALTTYLSRKAVSRRLAETPDDPDLPRLLAEQDRVADAVTVLRRITEQHPEQIERAFKGLPGYRFQMDRTEPHAQNVLDLVALARTKLTGLPRQDAARAAFALLPIESQLNPERNRTSAATLKALIAEYDGTDAARRADQRDACAPARALYSKASSLGHNVSGRQEDPTARFQQVLEIVRQLEQIDLRTCDGIGQLPDLVIQFYMYQPVFSSDATIDAMIDGYASYVRAHFVLDAANLSENGIGYVITRRMADLYARRGGRVAGVDRFLDELEKEASRRGPVRLLRAGFYAHLMADPPSGESIDRAVLRDKTISVLRALHAEQSQPYSRRALATLASFYFYDRDYTSARTVYQEYLGRYPESPWAWLAAFRLGETELERDDLPAAIAAFRRSAATEGPAAPLAQVFGSLNASNALGGLGRVSEALDSLRRASAAFAEMSEAWLQVRGSQKAGPGDEMFRRADSTAETSVYRTSLAGRVAALEESSRSRGGPSFERGRRLLNRARFDEARAAFERAVSDSRGTAFEARARAWAHRTELERALDLATIESPKRDETAAIRSLDALVQAPLDFNVTAARIARATIASSVGTAGADALMTSALDAWRAGQPRAGSPAPGLESDLYVIRSEVYRPLGGGVYATKSWNAFTWPARLPAFLVVNPTIRVNLASGEATQVTLRQPIPGFDNVLFVDEDGLAILARVMTALGGTRRRDTVQVMETPNQPIGRSLDIGAFWDRFFPTRPGHWSGWEFETYPRITDVTFADVARTRAFVRVTVGYSGATVVLVKQDGAWRAVELTNFWIT